MILHDLINEAVAEFEKAQLYYGHGTDNAWDEAVLLFSHVLRLPPDCGAEVLQRPLTEAEIAGIRDLYRRRIDERVPAAYLTGHGFFAGLDFVVTPDVLVPRSPIAELIEDRFSPWLIDEPQSILDLCTGCGCIGIAAAMCFPKARVELSDISAAAAEVARQNIERHGLSDRVSVVESDLFAALQGRVYDLILCNPPYVDAEDMAAMPQEYRAEPALALQSGVDGLNFTRRLLAEAGQHLSDRGDIFVEVGNSWEALEHAFQTVPFVWVEFTRGGHGVFYLSAQQLREHESEFVDAARRQG